MCKSMESIIETKAESLFDYIDGLMHDGEKYASQFSYVFTQNHVLYNKLVYAGVYKELMAILRANFPKYTIEVSTGKDKEVMFKFSAK